MVSGDHIRQEAPNRGPAAPIHLGEVLRGMDGADSRMVDPASTHFVGVGLSGESTRTTNLLLKGGLELAEVVPAAG